MHTVYQLDPIYVTDDSTWDHRRLLRLYVCIYSMTRQTIWILFLVLRVVLGFAGLSSFSLSSTERAHRVGWMRSAPFHTLNVFKFSSFFGFFSFFGFSHLSLEFFGASFAWHRPIQLHAFRWDRVPLPSPFLIDAFDVSKKFTEPKKKIWFSTQQKKILNVDFTYNEQPIFTAM